MTRKSIYLSGVLAVGLLLALVYGLWPNSLRTHCDQLISGVTHLVIVEAADMNTPSAIVNAYTRQGTWPTASWEPIAGPFKAEIGTAGLGWGYGFEHLQRGNEVPKREGDKRSPAGLYLLGPRFGFEDTIEAKGDDGYLPLKSQTLACVDDLASKHYGAIVDKDRITANTSHEDMAAIAVYKRGIVVTYPRDRKKKSGSCIFFHLSTSDKAGTAGCIAAEEKHIAHLQQISARATTAVLIWPRSAQDRLPLCLANFVVDPATSLLDHSAGRAN